MGASPLAGKFPPPFGNFQKDLTHLPLEISEKLGRKQKFNQQDSIC
jgi:hypothetical protein